MANVTASQYGFDNSKKSITCIVDIIETRAYKLTKVPITNLFTNLSFIILIILIYHLPKGQCDAGDKVLAAKPQPQPFVSTPV